MTVVFTVLGNPETQGNKTGFVRNGRAVLVEGRSKGARDRFHDWRAAISAEARRWMDDHDNPELLAGPLAIRLIFGLTKPASAPKTKVTWPIKARSGDIDKLARACLDACTGVLFVDDAQVVSLTAVKRWGNPPGVTVALQQLEDSQLEHLPGLEVSA